MLEQVITKIAGAFCDTLPEHKSSLIIEHNPHKMMYESIAEYTDNPHFENMWVSDIERQKAIETRELWVLTWYPNSPVGNCSIAGSTLQAVMVAMYESEVLRVAEEAQQASDDIVPLQQRAAPSIIKPDMTTSAYLNRQTPGVYIK